MCALTFSCTANATLIGHTISGNGIDLSPNSTTIDAGIEFSGIAGYLSFDFDSNTLTIASPDDLISWGGFGSYVFSGFDEIITSFNLVANSGFDPISTYFISDYSFTPNSLILNMNSGHIIDYNAGATAVFEINTATVPEPSGLAIFGLGLIGLLSSRLIRPAPTQHVSKPRRH